MKKVLMVMSHPDDEIIFGWPIIQDQNLEKHILICSTDEKSKERSWCAKRKEPFIELCKKYKIGFNLLNYNSNFYKLDSRSGPLLNLLGDIKKFIHSFDCDYIFTHNPLGEYGHLDHKLIFDEILRNSNKPILYTDIHIELPTWPSSMSNKNIKDLFFNKDFLFKYNVALDESLYLDWENVYRKHNVWTWSNPPIKTCNTFKLCHE
jgi:hypothetical protein